MAYENYTTLKINVENGVADVTIDNPPINLFDVTLITEMDRLGRELEVDDSVRVIVFESANRDFFIAHADVTLIQALTENEAPPPTEPSLFQQMCDRFRRMSKVSIAKISGIARGGGSEFALSLDMRFGSIGKAVLAQPEVALGIIPGGTGTQRLPRLMGRGRALEVILGCGDFSAEQAAAYGYINRALAPEEIDGFVYGIARRIAAFPAHALAEAKASVAAAESDPTAGMVFEAAAFNRVAAHPDTRKLMQAFMDKGGQTPEVARGNLEDVLATLGRS